MSSKRDYEKEITQALKEKPRNGLALQEDLNIPDIGKVLSSMEDRGLILWPGSSPFQWAVCNERSTLTEMLKVILPGPREPELKPIKEAIKQWLRTVSLGGVTQHTLQIIESTRKLLITLVDEP